MASNQKDTVYIDVDDEITSIIDKVGSSKERIVALVLPKRAAVLQSIVNMKLLKRSAESAKKHVVLITSETGLLPLAGAVGLYVAPTLQSRPAIPPAPDGISPDEVVDESGDFDPDAAAAKPIGQLAGPSAKMADDMETIELDNAADEPPGQRLAAAGAGAGLAAAAGKAAKAKKDRKLSIPDFNKFRLGLVLAGLAVVGLLVFGYFALFVMPKAVVTLTTDSSDITTAATITLDPRARELDAEDRVFPAKIETKQQTGSQQVAATGQRNKGERASGTVVLSLKDCSVDEVSIPAGTGVSSGGKTYITQSSATLQSIKIANKCSNSSQPSVSSKEVDVVAQTPGASYNIEPATFSVASFSMVSGQSSDPMSGGTDNIVKVVSQADIDSARNKISSQTATDAAKAELRSKLEDQGYIAIVSSAQASEPKLTPSAAVGDEAEAVTVSSVTTHTMYGVKEEDIETFVRENIKDKIDTSKQQVLDDGIAKATYEITSPATTGPLQVAFSAVSLAGPDIKPESLKSQIAGKKTNDVRTTATAIPGVTDVEVAYSPFWVSKVPTKQSKITIVIEKAPSTSNNQTTDGNE